MRALLCSQKPQLRYFGGQRLATDLTPSDIKAYRDARLAAGARPATINRELSRLRRGFDLALREELLDRAPVITMLEEDNIRTGFFEESDFQVLLAEAPEYLCPVLRFLYLTGWRSGEVLPLRWTQVDFRVGDFRRTAVRNLERAGVYRSVAMKLTGHKTESVYRRYAIVSESDLAEGLGKLAAFRSGPTAPRVVAFRGVSDTGSDTRPELRSADGI